MSEYLDYYSAGCVFEDNSFLEDSVVSERIQNDSRREVTPSPDMIKVESVPGQVEMLRHQLMSLEEVLDTERKEYKRGLERASHEFSLRVAEEVTKASSKFDLERRQLQDELRIAREKIDDSAVEIKQLKREKEEIYSRCSFLETQQRSGHCADIPAERVPVSTRASIPNADHSSTSNLGGVTPKVTRSTPPASAYDTHRAVEERSLRRLRAQSSEGVRQGSPQPTRATPQIDSGPLYREDNATHRNPSREAKFSLEDMKGIAQLIMDAQLNQGRGAPRHEDPQSMVPSVVMRSVNVGVDGGRLSPPRQKSPRQSTPQRVTTPRREEPAPIDQHEVERQNTNILQPRMMYSQVKELEDKLYQTCKERDHIDSEYSRVENMRIRTCADRAKKDSLYRLLHDLNKEVSSIRNQLRKHSLLDR